MLGCKDSGEKNMINSGHVRSSLLVVGNRNEADTHNHFKVVQFRMGKNDSRLSRMGRPRGKDWGAATAKGKLGGPQEEYMYLSQETSWRTKCMRKNNAFPR